MAGFGYRVRSFEDLEAWQGARQGVNGVYALTRKAGLVKDFGLCGQIQRAEEIGR